MGEDCQFLACQLPGHLELDPVSSAHLPTATVLDLTAEGTGGTLQDGAERQVAFLLRASRSWDVSSEDPVADFTTTLNGSLPGDHPWPAGCAPALGCCSTPLNSSILQSVAALSSPRTSESQLRVGVGSVPSGWVDVFPQAYTQLWCLHLLFCRVIFYLS